MSKKTIKKTDKKTTDNETQTFTVHYSFYLSDSVEIKAKSAKEAEEICEGMICCGEIGNLNEMEVGDSEVWVD